jgi:serine/threonine-protein kinase HipA
VEARIVRFDTTPTFVGEEALVEFIRRLVFNAAIGNADMHLKNWSLIYPDGRTPALAPGYDFVSTVRYIDDRSLALSIAKEKDTGKLDEKLLEKSADRARVPKNVVLMTALEIAERLVREWRRMKANLPLDDKARQAIDTQIGFVPITKKFQ